MREYENKLPTKAEVIALLKSYFAFLPDITMAFLFGSVAKGKATSGSDVDIAVYFHNGYDLTQLRKISTELENLLSRDVDLIVLNDTNPSIAWTAVRGIPLAIKDKAFFLEYMLEVSREAEDFNEFLLDLWKLRRERRRKQSHVG